MDVEDRSFTFEHNRKRIDTPLKVIKGDEDGPKVFISAGMHGDEINGIYLAGEFFNWLIQERPLKKGVIYYFPMLNNSGFKQRKRRLQIDNRDLNRQFGKYIGDSEAQNDSFSEAYADYLVRNFLAQCDMGVDLHDAGSSAIFQPHVRIHRSDEDDCISCTRSTARVFGSKYVMERTGSPNMMAVYMNDKHNTPVITVEIGGAQHIHEEVLDVGMRGLKNFLIANNMMEGQLDLPKAQFVISRRYLLRNDVAGHIEFNVALGDRVEAGEEVGALYDPLKQSYNEVVAPISGTVFSMWGDNQLPRKRNFMSIADLDPDKNESVIKYENYSVFSRG